MSQLSNAGVALPLPADFDFDLWMSRPADNIPPDNLDLKARNQDNVMVEDFNRTSIRDTRHYIFMVVKTGLDVGKPLLPFWQYAASELEAMTKSIRYCESVGPLPTYLCALVEAARANQASREAEEKLTLEKERAERDKAKAQRERDRAAPVVGSMVMLNPTVRNATRSAAVIIPGVYLNSIGHRHYPPLNWFTDERIRFAEQFGHQIFTKPMRPIATASNPAPKEVSVFDSARMVNLWGDDKLYSCLSPLEWQQSTLNYWSALVQLCPPPSNPPVANYADEFHKHRNFFLFLRDFERDYPLWYPFEREMHRDIMGGLLFDEAHYALQVQIILSTSRAVQYAGLAPQPFRDNSLKRAAETVVPEPRKVSKSTYDAQPGSSFRDSRNSQERSPSCLVCAGPHLLTDHPPATTTFLDGKPLFARKRGADIVTVKSFRGTEPQRICGSFNIGRPGGCQGKHSLQERLHICSFCGKDHPALSRDPNCPRVVLGQLLA